MMMAEVEACKNDRWTSFGASIAGPRGPGETERGRYACETIRVGGGPWRMNRRHGRRMMK